MSELKDQFNKEVLFNGLNINEELSYFEEQNLYIKWLESKLSKEPEIEGIKPEPVTEIHGTKTKEQILAEMLDIMPWRLNDEIKPYFLEAMQLYAEQWQVDRVTDEMIHDIAELIADPFDSSHENFCTGAEWIRKQLTGK